MASLVRERKLLISVIVQWGFHPWTQHTDIICLSLFTVESEFEVNSNDSSSLINHKFFVQSYMINLPTMETMETDTMDLLLPDE